MSSLTDSPAIILYICTAVNLMWIIWFFSDRNVRGYLAGRTDERHMGIFFRWACVFEILDLCLLAYHYLVLFGLWKNLIELVENLTEGGLA